MKRTRVPMTLSPDDLAKLKIRADKAGVSAATMATMLVHAALPDHRPDDAAYIRTRLVAELAHRYPDGAPDGTPWADADLTTIGEVATGLLMRARLTPEPVGVGAAFEEGWDMRHARDMSADASWSDATAARKADRARWEGGME